MPVLAQMLGCIAGGGAIGQQIAQRMAITDLPQLVAAFHSLVGLAACTTAVSSYMVDYDHLFLPGGGVANVSIFLGTFIGGVTLTGSLVAFAKLQVAPARAAA